MGFELAKRAVALGAEVLLISGPSNLELEDPKVKLIRVVSTEEMYNAVHKYFEEVDVAIAAAAVSDYKPQHVATQKIKKAEENLSLELTKTQDILLSMGENKTHQKLIGFALETNNELGNARGKLQKKNLDFIVLNSLNDSGAGFKGDTNKITLVFKDSEKSFELKSKAEVAADILNEIVHLLDA